MKLIERRGVKRKGTLYKRGDNPSQSHGPPSKEQKEKDRAVELAQLLEDEPDPEIKGFQLKPMGIR